MISDEEFHNRVEDFLLAHKTLYQPENQPTVDRARMIDYADLVACSETTLASTSPRSDSEAR